MDLLFLSLDFLDIAAVLIDIELRNATDLQFEQAFNILISHCTTAQFLQEGFKFITNGSLHAFVGLFLLNALVKALFNENSLECARMEKIIELAKANLEFPLQEREQTVNIAL